METRKIFTFMTILSIVLSLAYASGSFSDAYADSSYPLVLSNAQGESLTIGSVGVSCDSSNITVDIITDSPYPLNYSQLDFSHNSGGIWIAASSIHTKYFSKISDNHHRYVIPRSEIKSENAIITARADAYVNGAILPVRKAYVSVGFAVPQCTTTTTSTSSTTSTTETTGTTTTLAPTTTTTESTSTTTTEHHGGGGGGTTSTTTSGGGGGTTSTTVLATTTSTEKQNTTTTTGAVSSTTETTVLGEQVGNEERVTRNRLPFTGMDTNWYLIGFLLMVSGAGLYLGSAKKAAQ